MSKHKHRDSGLRCLVFHPAIEGQCIKCSICHEWLTPAEFYDREKK